MKRKEVLALGLSFVLTVFILIGISFSLYNSLKLFYKYIIITILMFIVLMLIIYGLILLLYSKLDKYKMKPTKKFNKITRLFDEHPMSFSFIIIIAGWLIYIIAFYPAILSKDPSFQILQFFGIDNKYSYYSVLLDESVIITNHHPIVHTLLLGGCLKFGLLFNSTNIGLFTYSLLQITILSLTLSYTIKFMKDLKINIKYRTICLVIYSLVPVFPLYAMSPVKDTIFTALIILYIILLWKIIDKRYSFNVCGIMKALIVMILIVLFRNNGFHIILLSFVFLIFIKHKDKYKIVMLFLSIIGFYLTYNSIILPYFKITPASKREMLSIPFQQTARYSLEHSEEVTSDEKKKIDKVLDYDTLAKIYKPEISDPVKGGFNKFSSKEDLDNYFKVWFQQLKKHPLTYVEATLNNVYGYFYPFKTNWYIYGNKFYPIINKYGFTYRYNSLMTLRQVLVKFAQIYPYIPIAGWFVNIGFSTYRILFMISYLIYRKKCRQLIYLTPSLAVLLVCIASPANTYFRYAMPNIFAMPVMFAIFLYILKSKTSFRNE